METNLNCDLAESSIYHSTINDLEILKLINTANIACGYHAGDRKTMEKTVELAIKYNVSIGPHPGFKDTKNFGRKKINLSNREIKKLVYEQILILYKIAESKGLKISHVKVHGALNNMACEDYYLSKTIGEAIKEFDRDLIYLVLPVTEMEKAAKDLNLKTACEIFADRNYNDNGQLISRDKPNALITNPLESSNNILKMLHDQSIYCFSGKRIPCNIDSICVHGDNENALDIIKTLKNNIENEGFVLKSLDKLSNFI